jgi:general secretion pathway protein D
VDVNQVLDVYAQLVGRTLIRAALPAASVILQTQTPLTKSEAIQALQAVLALNNISVVNVGDKFVKVLPSDQANAAGAEFNTGDSSALPNLGTYVTRIVQLKNIKPSEMVPVIQPFARLANSILPIDSNGILVIRDYAENVKRMLQMIEQIDVSVPAEFISEVIPIRYALATDIANALNSLGGAGGGSTVSIGSSATTGSTGARTGGGGLGGGNNQYGNGLNNNNQNNQQNRGFGGQNTPNGTANTGTSFQQRIQSIIQRAATPGGQQDQIQVFGQTKLIADERSNSLLVFATRADMERIKEVIGKLDVLLSQVLIEAVIMDVTLGKTFNFGVSVAQQQKNFGNNSTAGGVNNGQPFYNFMQQIGTNLISSGTNLFPGNFTSVLPGGAGQSLSYFGNIGPTWDVAVQAAASDNSVSVIQRPRIQTSQAKAASFFVGQTVPYVTSTTFGGSAYGNSSSYSQLSIGIQMDVTPFINPDGLVVMDINQEIDDISSYTTIDNNPVPNTSKRTLSSEIAVKDRDTILLGGFIRTDKSKTRSGVPFLMDIPLLGNLFSQRSDNKDRSETVVLIRPTVLRTPDLAAVQAIKEQRRLPGISAAAADAIEEEHKQVAAQIKLEQKRLKLKKQNAEYYDAPLPGSADTNSPPPVNPFLD